MRAVLLKLLSLLYRRARSSSYFRSLYYSVVNTQYVADLELQEGMLADRVRVDTYHDAIVKHVGPGHRVIDLGTGTGILSFLAASRRPQRIYALDHGPIIEYAKATAEHNGFQNIEFVSTNSRDFTLPEKVDFILHEQMGSFLFDERMIENILDLRDRLLKRGGKILPAKFEWFIEPVKIRDDKVVPFVWERKIHGVDFACLKDRAQSLGARYLWRQGSGEIVDYLLAEPSPALEVDMETMSPQDQPRRMDITRTITRSGRLDGFCTYFRTIFDEEISFTTEPPQKTLHWSMPLFRVEAREVHPGDRVRFHLEMDDLSDPETYTWTLDVEQDPTIRQGTDTA